MLTTGQDRPLTCAHWAVALVRYAGVHWRESRERCCPSVQPCTANNRAVCLPGNGIHIAVLHGLVAQSVRQTLITCSVPFMTGSNLPPFTQARTYSPRSSSRTILFAGGRAKATQQQKWGRKARQRKHQQGIQAHTVRAALRRPLPCMLLKGNYTVQCHIVVAATSGVRHHLECAA